jgi:hypothetical protein
VVGRDEQRAIVERSTILRGAVGSTLHGLHHGGQDDRDEMGVAVNGVTADAGRQVWRW